MQKFCKDVPAGQGRRIACLAKHKDQLNPACRTMLPTLQGVVAAGKH